MHRDEITPDDLRRIGGVKWSRYGDALGAFIAETDFGTAEPIKRAVHEAVDLGRSGYLAPGWIADLQQATCSFVERRYGRKVSPDNVVLAPDVLAGLVLMMKHFMRPNGRVVVPTPAYMPFMFLPQAHGHELVQVPMLHDDDGWHLDLETIDDVLREGDLFVHCNPHNPVGKVYTVDEMVALSEVVERNGARVFNDEIHAPLVYEGHKHVPYPTVSEAADRHSITSMSASKAWNIPGYKCAQLILNGDDLAKQESFAFDIGEPSTPGVFANIAAFNEGEEWVDDTVAYLARNERRLVELLPEELPQVRFTPNQGTYLAWLDCSALGIEKAGEFFHEHAGVVTTDGASCGEIGIGNVRFNYGAPLPVVEEMIRRMGAAVREHRG